MFKKIMAFYSNRFKYTGKEKVSKVTWLFIMMLNIFAFTVLTSGISFQGEIYNSYKTYYPRQCINIMKTPDNLLKIDSYYYTSNHLYSDYLYGRSSSKISGEASKEIKKREMSKECLSVFESIEKIKISTNSKAKLELIRKINSEAYKNKNDLNYIKAKYDTTLFEKIAEQPQNKSILKDGLTHNNVKKQYNDAKKAYEDKMKKIDNLRQAFKNHPDVQKLYVYINESKEDFLDEYKNRERNSFSKKKIAEILFILPIFMIFYFGMRYFIRKENYIFFLIFKNLAIVSLIPLLFLVGQLIYNHLPKVFISKLILFFYSLEIPFAVYYLLLFIGVILFIGLIVFLQKRYQKKIEEEKNNNLSAGLSYSKSICNSCRKTVNYETMNFCPHCSDFLKETCEHCKEKKIKNLNFCSHCGK